MTAGAASPEFLALQQAVVGRYSLERELGRGGMGIVFLAHDVALERLVAIKLLPPAQAAQPALRERFIREARTAARLSHPNIVPIYLVEEHGGLVYFVMAYVEGETLGQRLRSRGALAPPAGVRVLQEVAWALAYAHLRAIVHRDVKPDNILLESGSNRAMVTDFGIARAGEISGSTAVGEIIGTAQYMSPEQCTGEPVDGRSDLYSLGVVGYLTLSGKLPFESPDMPALLAMHITRPPAPLSSVAPGVPARVAQAVDRCLAKRPEDRWPTGEAFAEALAESQAVLREIPVPLRLWLTKGDGARGILHGWTFLTGLAGVGELLGALWSGGNFDTDILWMLAVPWTVFMLYRLYQTQRVVASGYTIEDVRAAVRQHLEHRREELVFEYDRDPPLWARVVRKLAFSGLGMAILGTAYAVISAQPDAQLTAYLLGGGAALAGGGALIGRMVPGKRLKARDTTLDWRARLVNSRFGEWLFKFAAVGVGRSALPSSGMNRPTELAIGFAADQVFESLPRETRKELKELPALLRRLEAEARGTRARVDELNALMAGLGDDGAPQRSATLRDSPAGLVAADSREQLRQDLTDQRDKAAERLSEAVGALENIRLDLLRLKAGVGTVDQLTQAISAAQHMQKEIDLAVEANREVEAALRSRPAS